MTRTHAVGLALALAACGDNLAGDGDDGAGATPWTRAVVYASPRPVLAAPVMADGRIAVLEATLPAADAPRCPDCELMMLPDDVCPAACARAGLSLQWLDADGRAGARIELDRFAIGPGAERIGSASALELGGGEVALAWTRCLGAPAHACTTHAARLRGDALTPGGGPAPATRVGTVALVDDGAGAATIVRGWPDAYPFTLPFRVELTAAGGAPRLVGSSQALMPSASVTPRGAWLFVEDRHPGAAELACPPCPRFDACATGAWPPAGHDCVQGASADGGLGRTALGGAPGPATPVVRLARADGVIRKIARLTAASGAWPTALIDVEERGLIVVQERADGWRTWAHGAASPLWFTPGGTGWVADDGAVTVAGFTLTEPFPPGYEHAAPAVEVRRYHEDRAQVEYQAEVHLGPVTAVAPLRPLDRGGLATTVVLAEGATGADQHDRWVVWYLVRSPDNQ